MGSTYIFHGKWYNSIFPGISNSSDFKSADKGRRQGFFRNNPGLQGYFWKKPTDQGFFWNFPVGALCRLLWSRIFSSVHQNLLCNWKIHVTSSESLWLKEAGSVFVSLYNVRTCVKNLNGVPCPGGGACSSLLGKKRRRPSYSERESTAAIALTWGLNQVKFVGRNARDFSSEDDWKKVHPIHYSNKMRRRGWST